MPPFAPPLNETLGTVLYRNNNVLVLMFKLLLHMVLDCTDKDAEENTKKDAKLCCNCFSVLEKKAFPKILGYSILYASLSILLVLFIAYAAILYFLIPINNAIEDAPDRLNTIVSGGILVFGSYLIYILTTK